MHHGRRRWHACQVEEEEDAQVEAQAQEDASACQVNDSLRLPLVLGWGVTFIWMRQDAFCKGKVELEHPNLSSSLFLFYLREKSSQRPRSEFPLGKVFTAPIISSDFSSSFSIVPSSVTTSSPSPSSSLLIPLK